MAPINVDAPLSAAFKRNKTGNKFKRFPRNKFTKNFVKKSNIAKPSEGSKKVKKTVRFSDDLSVRINISNLAPTVNTDDLREVFNEYNIENVSVYSDQNGQPTGDITVSKHSGDRLIRDFKGVTIDDKELKLTIIGKQNILNRISLPNRKKLTPPGLHQRSSKARQSNKARKTKKEASMKMTVEQLDAELEAYMNKV